MRIAHFKSRIWHQGGVSTYIRTAAAAQVKAGHEVYLLDDAHTADADWAGLPDPIILPDEAAVFSYCLKLGVDVLNLHELVFSKEAFRLPVVLTLHGHGAYCPSGSQHFKNSSSPCPHTAGRCCIKGHLKEHCGSLRPANVVANVQRYRAHRVALPHLHTITVSQFQKQRMIQAGYHEDRIQVVLSPAPKPSVPFTETPKKGTPHFLFLGRLVPEKGLSWLLESFAQLQVEAHLDVAGDGYAADALQQQASELGLGDRVTFHGWVDGAEKQELLQASRVLVFPSVWHEPAGLVSLEAASCGRPVIASASGGIPEYVTKEYGVLVEPGSVAGLTRQMEKLAQDRDQADTMGRAGRAVATEQFTLENFQTTLTTAYERIIAAHTIARARA